MSGTTSEVQRVRTSGTTTGSKGIAPFKTYINHRVLFHHFLRRFPQ